MKNLLTFLLIGFAVAACAPVPPQGGVGKSGTTQEIPLKTQEESGAANNGPAVGSLPESLPLVVTVRPPLVPIEPVQGSQPPPGSIPLPPSNNSWRTFTSTHLGISVDYPPDWSATEQPAGVSFTSPQGLTVLLQVLSAGGGGDGNPAGNAQCTLLVNTYGLTVNACGDTASDHYFAGFHIQRADGSTASREALDVYKAMLNSLRPA